MPVGLDVPLLPGGIATKLPKLPIRIDGEAFAFRANPPDAGQDTRAILDALHAKEKKT